MGTLPIRHYLFAGKDPAMSHRPNFAYALRQVLPVLILPAVLATPRISEAAMTAEQIDKALETRREALIELRRDIHRHPEVSGEEVRTAGLVAKRLHELDLEVREGIGGHGVVAVIEGKKNGPVVAFRADMDAVPSDEPDPVPFASETPGVRHICGHDVHTTVGIAIAEVLASNRDQLPGTVVLYFQPAEENATGARAMLDNGAMQDPKPQALTGGGDLEAAAQAVMEAVASITTMDIEKAAAGQMIEGEFILGQTVAVRPAEVPNQLHVINQVTVNSTATRKQAAKQIRERLQALQLKDVEYELDYKERYTSGVDNDEEMIERAGEVLMPVLGEDAYLVTRGTIPFFSEDFGFFQDEAPGVMFWLGVSNSAKGTVGLPHSPNYVADEEAIFVGAKAMTLVLLDFLENPTE
jgi:metal-dependent amidase/aminoacylase/carboxypeptidase family protein